MQVEAKLVAAWQRGGFGNRSLAPATAGSSAGLSTGGSESGPDQVQQLRKHLAEAQMAVQRGDLQQRHLRQWNKELQQQLADARRARPKPAGMVRSADGEHGPYTLATPDVKQGPAAREGLR